MLMIPYTAAPIANGMAILHAIFQLICPKILMTGLLIKP